MFMLDACVRRKSVPRVRPTILLLVLSALFLATLTAGTAVGATVGAAAGAAADAEQGDILMEFKRLDMSVTSGRGLADRIISAGAGRTAGSYLAWSASYVWDAYITAYEVSGDTLWLDKLVRDFDAAFAVRDDVLKHADYRGEVRPVWGTFGYTGDEYHAWVVHNGWAAYQMLRFAKLVLRSPDLKVSYGAKAQEYVARLEETVTAFDDQWREGPLPGQGFYIFREDMPFDYRGRKMPLNQHNAMGLTLFLLADITGNESYFQKAAAMANYFRSVIKKLPNGSYVWTYWGNENEVVAEAPALISAAVNSTFSGEDISHAVINARFAYEAYLHDVAFTEDDMRAIARTVVENIWDVDSRGNSGVYWQMNRRGNRYTDGNLIHISRGWTFLAQFDPRVLIAAQQTYDAAGSSASGVLRLLGQAQLVRWQMTEEQIYNILNKALESGDPYVTPFYLINSTPGAGEVISGPTALKLEYLSVAPITGFELKVDDILIHRGPSLPEELVINQGELADGDHLLQLTVTADKPQRRTYKHTISFKVDNLHIVNPVQGQKTKGVISIGLASALPAEAVAKIQVHLNEQIVFSGTEIPAELRLDTREVPDGFHHLKVTLTTKGGTVSERTVGFWVENMWTLSDLFAAPTKSLWFGDIDFAKTLSTSPGWGYATDNPDLFSGDNSRRVRTQDSTEYLIWEAPRLYSVEAIVYVKNCSAVAALQFHTSVDQSRWEPLSYTVSSDTCPGITAAATAEATGTGAATDTGSWHKLQVKAEVPAGRQSAYFRLTLTGGIASPEAIQLGEVLLTGYLDLEESKN